MTIKELYEKKAKTLSKNAVVRILDTEAIWTIFEGNWKRTVRRFGQRQVAEHHTILRTKPSFWRRNSFTTFEYTYMILKPERRTK